jgi:cytochrome c-type biogenesis protein CcsB
MKKLLNILPWIILAVFVLEIVAVMVPKKDRDLHTREFGRLPVLLNGRIQPFDSVGRNALLQIRSTAVVPLEEKPFWKFWSHPPKLKPTPWLMEVMMKPDLADTRPVFLIHHPDLLSELKLGDKGVEKSGLRYYTFNEIKSVIHEIGDQGEKAGKLKPEERTPFQRQAFKLANAVMLYHRLKNSLQPEQSTNFVADLQQYEAGLRALYARESGEPFDEAVLKQMAEIAGPIQMVSRMAYPLIIPPLPGESRDHWVNMGASLLRPLESLRDGRRLTKEDTTIHPAAKYFASMITTYQQSNQQGKEAEFNQAVASYREWLAQGFSEELKKGRAEFYYNDTKAFLHSIIIYIAAFVLAIGGLLTLTLTPNLSESLRKSSYYIIILAGLVHTYGLIFRMWLEGRPPVTNLYSSAIFIGWGAMVLGLILERIFRAGLGNAVASLAGFVTLFIAHNLALDGDTMEMLQAVLDTNFWLATHVTIITLGYAATYAGGLLALFYIVFGLLTPVLSQNTGRLPLNKILAKMVYGIICFATLFSFVGTILGGIWADQSWGRFWGWDPKENGALIIVLWNATILHARWGGWVKERGLMNMAIFGNIVTSFSWFGVNMLGIGLHSYGFMDGAFKWLYGFILSQIAFMLLGGIPLKYWRSFRGITPSEPPPAPPSGPGKAIPASAG